MIDIVANRGHRKVLIAAPLSVVQEWPRQFATHSARDVMVVPLDDRAGSVKAKTQKAKVAMMKADLEGVPLVIVVNYDSVWRPPFGPIYDEQGKRIKNEGFALGVDWDMIVADECHRISAAGSKVSRFFAKLGKKAKHRLGLTGTPFASGPLSIYGQYRFLDSGIFGTNFDDFRSRYAILGQAFQGQIKGYVNQDELQEKFYSIAYRVESRDVLDLPEEMHIRRYCHLSPVEKRHYKELEEQFITEVKDGTVTATNALVKLLRLQQMTSGFVRLDPTDQEEGVVSRVGDSKQRLLEEVLEDLDVREPVVVFCRFTHDLEAVKEVCKKQKRTYAELSGRVKQISEWRDGQYDVLGVQIRAGNAGIDLTRSHYCVYMSLGYSLGDFQQSVARTMRPGQKHNCTYVHLIAAGTVDQRVYDAIDTKTDVVKSILDRVPEEGVEALHGKETP